MEENAQIIIDYFRKGKSQREISRELGISRNTVRKYISHYQGKLTDGSGAISSAGQISAPVYDSSSRSRRKLTEEVVAKIASYLSANEQKRRSGKSKQQMKNVDIHAALLDAGYDIGYSTVCEYIHKYKSRSKEVFIRQRYTPGSSVEFDWGEVKLEIGGKQKQLMLAVFTSCYSNHRWSMLFYRQDMVSFLQAHVSYFSSVGYVSGEVVYDNMRVAVRRFALKQSDKQPTEALLKLSAYYGFSYRFCNVGKGNEKGHVERSVEVIRRKAFCRTDRFESLEQANAHLQVVCEKINQGRVKGRDQSIAEAFELETSYMREAPPAYVACSLKQVKVNKYSCIRLDNNFYSLKEGYVGRQVEVRIYAHRIEIRDPQTLPGDTPLGLHPRRHSREQWYIQLDHYLQTLSQKPGALKQSEAWYQADPRLHSLFKAYFENQPRIFIELLIWARKQTYDIEAICRVAQQAALARPNSPISLEVIQLLAQGHMRPALHSPAHELKTSDTQDQRICTHATEQLEQAQNLFNSSYTR
ncbi:MAG: IS21 family transposase [Bacteroidota bacterium]